MKNIHFKPIMLLALLFPLLVSYAGYLLYYSSQDTAGQSISSTVDNKVESNEPVLINNPVTPPPVEKEEEFGFKQLYLYVALLAGVFALLFYYLRTSLGWLAVILLSIAFAVLYFNKTSIGLTAFFIPNLVFAALFALVVRHLFFYKAFIRFRMIVVSLVGAGLLTLYLRSLYFLAKVTFDPQNWALIFVSAMILFVFVTFGMSMADLVIMRSEMKTQRAEIDTDFDEEGDDSLNA